MIEIITHCYAEELPHYADALVYQLSSFVLHKPKSTKVKIVVCRTSTDERTKKVIDWFLKNTNLRIDEEVFTWQALGRRSIGRNHAAKRNQAELVWFTDVDHVFYGDLLDRLWQLRWKQEWVMVFPKSIMIHQDHATGDRATSLVSNDPQLIDIRPEEFIPKGYGRAIGGVQIVKGWFAREYGYLNGDGYYQEPVDKPFGSFRDDIAYRKFCCKHGVIVPVDLPGLYRIRHTKTTYQ